MSEERSGASKPRSEDTVQSLRRVFELLWPVDRKPVFGGLLKVIDEFDREQRRRRKHRNGAERSS